MTQPERNVQINISGIPVAGVGGFGLVAMAVLVSIVMPAARVTMVAGLIGGVLLAVILVIARRRFEKRDPGGRAPAILFVESPAERAQLPPKGGSYNCIRPAYSTR